MTLDTAPVGTVVMLGHPANATTATKREDGRWYGNVTSRSYDNLDARNVTRVLFNPDDPGVDPTLDRQRLDMARKTLVDVGYFTADEVSDDVAPRISELVFAIRDGKFDPADAFGRGEPDPDPEHDDDDDPVQYVVPAPVRPALERPAGSGGAARAAVTTAPSIGRTANSRAKGVYCATVTSRRDTSHRV